MGPVIVNGRIGCSKKEAMAFLGIGQDRFGLLQKQGIIKPLGLDWYSYADLWSAIEARGRS